MLIGQILDRAVRRAPHRTAIIFQDRSYTFRQLAERVNRLANAFLDMGLSKGDRVATVVGNIPEYHETMFATTKAGLVLQPINYRYLEDELTDVINDGEASVLVVAERYRDKVEAISSRLPSVKHYICIGESATMTNYDELLANYPPDNPRVDISHEDLCFILYTSGTTSHPKGVMFTHRNAFAGLLGLNEGMGLVPEKDVVLFCAPTYHIAGAVKVAATTLFLNPAILLEFFEAGAILENIEEYRVTNYFSVLVPTMLTALIDHPDFSRYDLSSLRRLYIGACVMNQRLLRRVVEAFGPICVNTFSLTEGGATVMEPLSLDLPPEKARRLESCGREGFCLTGEVRVVDDIGKDVLPGEIGEILTRGEAVMKGYWKMPEETAKVIDKDGWLHTGDLATVDEDGYLYIKGRKKEIIRSGGENIAPFQVEEVISRHPAVKEVAVIGEPDEHWTETVKAVVVLREGTQATEEEIIKFCKKRLASYKAPKSVVFVDSLPMGASGIRVAKVELQKRYSKGFH